MREELKRGDLAKALMRGTRVNYHNSGFTRTDWSWQPKRAKQQLAKERRDKERT